MPWPRKCARRWGKKTPKPKQTEKRIDARVQVYERKTTMLIKGKKQSLRTSGRNTWKAEARKEKRLRKTATAADGR